MTLFSVFILAAPRLRAVEQGKNSSVISEKCPENLFCYPKDSVLYVGNNTSTYNEPAGKVNGEIIHAFVSVLKIQVRTEAKKEPQIWLNAKLKSGNEFWILQTNEISAAEPLTEEDILSLRNDDSFFKKTKNLTEPEMIKKINSETFTLGALFDVQKMFDNRYPVFKGGQIIFSNTQTYETTGVFKFKSCNSLEKILRKKFDMKRSEMILSKFNLANS